MTDPDDDELLSRLAALKSSSSIPSIPSSKAQQASPAQDKTQDPKGEEDLAQRFLRLGGRIDLLSSSLPRDKARTDAESDTIKNVEDERALDELIAEVSGWDKDGGDVDSLLKEAGGVLDEVDSAGLTTGTAGHTERTVHTGHAGRHLDVEGEDTREDDGVHTDKTEKDGKTEKEDADWIFCEESIDQEADEYIRQILEEAALNGHEEHNDGNEDDDSHSRDDPTTQKNAETRDNENGDDSHDKDDNHDNQGSKRDQGATEQENAEQEDAEQVEEQEEQEHNLLNLPSVPRHTHESNEINERDEPTLNLPSAPTTIPGQSTTTNKPTHPARPPSVPSTRPKFTDEEIDSWCIICQDDATVRCLGCDGDLYCELCWREGHTGEDAGYEERRHRCVVFNKRKKALAG